MEKEKPILLAVDPSVRDFGWALVDLNKETVEGEHFDLENDEIWHFGIIQMESTERMNPDILKYRWIQAFNELVAKEYMRPTHFASEWPTYFDSERGRIAAQLNYTLGIASIVGYMVGQFNFAPNEIELWTPSQWKGTANKTVIRNQFIEVFGKYAERLDQMLSDDVVEAIMIARHWLTIYDKGKFDWQEREANAKG